MEEHPKFMEMETTVTCCWRDAIFCENTTDLPGRANSLRKQPQQLLLTFTVFIKELRTLLVTTVPRSAGDL